MGLDMFLKAKRYLGNFDNSSKIQDQFPELKGMKSPWGESVVSEVSIDVGYWRKANAIHHWFVDNVQNGEDKCRPHYVSKEKLLELRGLVEQALENKADARNILPTTKGFFFGSIDYDQFYFDDLRLTLEIIDRALKLPKEWSLEYQSSW